MSPQFRIMLVLSAVAIGLIALDCVARRMERRGWIYWRKRKPAGGGGAMAGMLTGFQQIVEPQVEYRIRREDRAAFVQAMQRLSMERHRDGAYAWGLTEDAAEPERVMEWFLVESWAEHMRQHRRVSHADADLQAEATRFHIGPGKPEVHHFLAL